MKTKYLRIVVVSLLVVLSILVGSCTSKKAAQATSSPATFSQIRVDIDQLSSSINNMSTQSAATATQLTTINAQLTEIHNQLTAIESKLGMSGP
jgi:septal ring factor EnvC (AmiA/AmiB activator)